MISYVLPQIYHFKIKGLKKIFVQTYKPSNKFERLHPIASDILFNLLMFVRSVNWFIKFLLTRISLQMSETVLFLSLSSFFIFSTILFFIFMCLFGRFLYYSCVCSGQIYIKTYFFTFCLTKIVRVQNLYKLTKNPKKPKLSYYRQHFYKLICLY